jgi:hypothetical protein
MTSVSSWAEEDSNGATRTRRWRESAGRPGQLVVALLTAQGAVLALDPHGHLGCQFVATLAKARAFAHVAPHAQKRAQQREHSESEHDLHCEADGPLRLKRLIALRHGT